MTKRIRKLLGYLLIACLLLSSVSALAENGKITMNITDNPDLGFVNPNGITFELYQVGEPSGQGTSWKPTEGFKAVDLLTKMPADESSKKWSDDEAKAIATQVEAVLGSSSKPAPDTTGETILGKVIFDNLPAGIYYIRKSPDSRPKLLQGTGSLIAIPSLGEDNPDVVDGNPYEINGRVKYTYVTPEPTSLPVEKIWDDQSDFDGVQPDEITFHLFRNGTELTDKKVTVKRPTEADVKWGYTWTDLEAANEDGVRYVYTASEDQVANYDKPVIETESNADGTTASVTVTNPHTPQYGALTVTKAVQVDGEDTTTTMVDETYAFTITGPTEYTAPKTRNALNYLDNVPFTISITGGKSNTWSRDKLMPGKYIIKEVGVVDAATQRIVAMPAGITSEATGANGVEVTVEASTAEKPATAFTIINNMTTGSLSVTKAITIDGRPATEAQLKLIDETFSFTVTGPRSYTGNVDVTVKDGKITPGVLTGLKPGDYTVTEDTSKLSKGISVAAGNGVTVTVNPGATASATVTNDIKTGSLRITKRVTVNNGNVNGRTLLDGNYTFNITSKTGYSNQVSIRVRNGRSTPVTVSGLLPGEYTVSENKTNMPTGVVYVSGDETKTLDVTVHTADKPLEFTFTNNRTVTNPPPGNPTPTPTARVTNEPTPTPTPSPTPTPAININGQKVWNDEGNIHNTRPNSITVQLMRNGAQIREITVNGDGNRWSYRFQNLPQVDPNGVEYSYTVRESEVAGYTTSYNGTTIVNDLIPQTPREYTNFSGIKIWDDNNDADGTRPNYIVVRLMRDGQEVERRTVTAANGWQFTFQNIPLDDGYGNPYTYYIREDAVSGYVGRIEEFQITNSRLTDFEDYGIPLAGFDEPELEELLELYDYSTPLWGRPLKTGDDIPLYPIVFGGIGLSALVALAILIVIGKKRENNAA